MKNWKLIFHFFWIWFCFCFMILYAAFAQRSVIFSNRPMQWGIF